MYALISNFQFLAADPAAAKPDESKIPAAMNEKAQLCSCLAAIGGLKKAREILLRLPVLSRMYPEIAVNICRLLGEVIEPVYAPLRPSTLFTRPVLPGRLELVPSHPLLNVDCRLEDVVVSAKKGPHVQRGGFFYQKWKIELGRAEGFNAVLGKMKVFMRMIGFHLAKDNRLFVKIVRIAKAHILV
jgi:hypothetical protein